MTNWTALFAALRQAAQDSPHPSDKIAAQILYKNGLFDVPYVNARPSIINGLNIPLSTKIADRSLYAHAETRAILHASRALRGATLLVTDPFCPNCMKQIALAGIKRVVIDGDGFAKPYFIKNDSAFQTVSLSIADYFGIKVFTYSKGELQRLTPSETVLSGVHDTNDRAVLPVDGVLTRRVSGMGQIMKGSAFTFKYDARIEAIHVALLHASRRGLKFDDKKSVLLNSWPASPRPFVDALVAGVRRYRVADTQNAPDWAGALHSIGVIIEAD